MSAIVAIPARLESTRFPRKVLASILGEPMLWRVYQQSLTANLVDEVWILTDSDEIFALAQEWGANVKMTSTECVSGTDRIASVADQFEADIIVNVQGDEPLIKGELIDSVISVLDHDSWDVATPVFRLETIDQIMDPNLVKVVRAFDGTAIYFSRSPVPYVRDFAQHEWINRCEFWGHIGVYAYSKKVLIQYPEFNKGALESAEQLEQLRLLEAGVRIITMESDYKPHGVDVPADLEVVVSVLESSGRSSNIS